MKPLTVWLDDGYCSITVANRRLITVIRFVVKSYIYPWKDFANKLRLVLHAWKILFSGIARATHATGTRAQNLHAASHHAGTHAWALGHIWLGNCSWRGPEISFVFSDMVARSNLELP